VKANFTLSHSITDPCEFSATSVGFRRINSSNHLTRFLRAGFRNWTAKAKMRSTDGLDLMPG
jgi:hypothetical protein